MIFLSANPHLGHLLPLGRPGWRAVLEHILESLGLAGAELDLSLTGDREIASLNRTWLGCSGPTNVLSFPHQAQASGRGPAGPGRLGEIALSLETLRREAFLYHLDPAEYAARLLAHAVLHLAGLDHGPEMEALTEKAVAEALQAHLSSI